MKIIIIGSGACGLTLAFLLKKAGADITILESSPSIGGLMGTFDTGNNNQLEYFYHHFFTHDSEINWLLRELQLSDHITFLPTSMGIYKNGYIYNFNGPSDLLNFSPIGMLDRLRFGISSSLLAFKKSYSNCETIPALDWLNFWAGRKSTEAIWRPMLNVKFGEDATKIPLAWLAGRLRQRVLSRKKGQEKLGYLRGSLKVLLDNLSRSLVNNNVKILPNTGVTKLACKLSSIIGVETSQGFMEADLVVSTIPTPIFSNLVKPIYPDYATSLDKISYLAAQCLVLSFDRKISPVYWLNIADPDYDFGGIIEHTNFIDPNQYNGQHIIYLSKYLLPNNPLWTMTKDELLSRQIPQLESIFKIPLKKHLLNSWVFRGRYAAPLPQIGFNNDIPLYKSPIHGLFNASMCHVYPDERSVNNSIRVATELATAMGFSSFAKEVPKGSSLSDKYGKG